MNDTSAAPATSTVIDLPPTEPIDISMFLGE